VVVDEGRIIAVGKHRQLLRSNDRYRQLTESQTLTMGKEGDD
jgi:ABC-type multidrug transport system fused ATPase/permease subunit